MQKYVQWGGGWGIILHLGDRERGNVVNWGSQPGEAFGLDELQTNFKGNGGGGHAINMF